MVLSGSVTSSTETLSSYSRPHFAKRGRSAVDNNVRCRTFGKTPMDSCPRGRVQKPRRRVMPATRQPVRKGRSSAMQRRKRTIGKPKKIPRPIIKQRKMGPPYQHHPMPAITDAPPRRQCVPSRRVHNQRTLPQVRPSIARATKSNQKITRGGGFYNFLRIFKNMRQNLSKDQAIRLGVEAWCNLTQSQQDRFEVRCCKPVKTKKK